MKEQQNPPRPFFTPVSNSVFLDRKFTTAARQILLILELKAGASRLAKIGDQALASQTGYHRRTVKRAIESLVMSGWIGRSIEPGKRGYDLLKPVPSRDFVQVYESVVHHAEWEHWQKHVLLFVQSQFRCLDPEFGVPFYSLNLRGRKQPSIETHCRVPGTNPKVRRAQVRQFLEHLKESGVIAVIREATSQKPAICTVSREALEKLPMKTHRTGRSRQQTEPNVSGKPNRFRLMHRTGKADQPIQANGTSRTDVEDAKEPKEPAVMHPEPPGPPAAVQGGLAWDKSGAFDSDGSAKSTSSVSRKRTEYELTLFMEPVRQQRLTKEVEDNCLGDFLVKSHDGGPALASVWSTVLDQLPDDLQSSDVIEAITSTRFERLHFRSWGLLLSAKFIQRFFDEIMRHYGHRKRMADETKASYLRVCSLLRDPDPARRLDAVERLSVSYMHDPKTPRLLAGLLLGENRDDDPDVRIAVMHRLSILTLQETHATRIDAIRQVIERLLRDEHEEVREEARHLLHEMTDKAR